MTTISNSTNSLAAATGQTNDPIAPPPKQNLGQDDFFKLMIAQMKNQDPTKPLDGQQYLGQLAQFSTLKSIQELQVSFDKLARELKPASADADGAGSSAVE
jgi:flagellar basal-body rod modification protein FlgD